MKVLVSTSVINNLFPYKNSKSEVGGYLSLIIKRRGDDILYMIMGFGESTKESGAVSAVISSSTPHI